MQCAETNSPQMAISSKIRPFYEKLQREANPELYYTDKVQVPVCNGGHMNFHFGSSGLPPWKDDGNPLDLTSNSNEFNSSSRFPNDFP